MNLNMHLCFPQNAKGALLLGRVWKGGFEGGPYIVLIEGDQVFDISPAYPLMAELLNQTDLNSRLLQVRKEQLEAYTPFWKIAIRMFAIRNNPTFWHLAICKPSKLAG